MHKRFTFLKFFKRPHFPLLIYYFRDMSTGNRKHILDYDPLGSLYLNSINQLILCNRINNYVYFLKSLGSTSKQPAIINRASY